MFRSVAILTGLKQYCCDGQSPSDTGCGTSLHRLTVSLLLRQLLRDPVLHVGIHSLVEFSEFSVYLK